MRPPTAKEDALTQLGVARVRAGEITREMVAHNLGVIERSVSSLLEIYREWRRGDHPNAGHQRAEIREQMRDTILSIRCCRRVLEATEEATRTDVSRGCRYQCVGCGDWLHGKYEADGHRALCGSNHGVFVDRGGTMYRTPDEASP